MITSYDLTLTAEDPKLLYPDCAYRLYSWLLSRIPREQGERFHLQEDHPVSQYICREKDDATARWQVNLLTEQAISLFSPILEAQEEIVLHAGTLSVLACTKGPVKSPRELLLEAAEANGGRVRLRFRAPTSFRQNGAYVRFPQERLILRSLANRWNSFCPEYPLDDEDALRMLEQGIRITDYSLRSQRYSLKESCIPGFVGSLTLSASLPAPLVQLWNTLLCWAPYSGLGIKTALGMGGVSVIRQGRALPSG